MTTTDRLAEYEQTYASVQVRPGKASAVDAEARKVLAGRRLYVLASVATGVPWGVIGCLHARESDCDFTTHLHNGDPLTHRTRHVPPGRPLYGAPPFAWEDSAADALRYDHIDDIAAPTEWTIAFAAAAFETFNGFGYRHFGMVDPYLWACSTVYTSGKFDRDGHLERTLVDVQPGAMMVLRRLLELAPDALDAASLDARPLTTTATPAVVPAVPPVTAPASDPPLHKSPTVHFSLGLIATALVWVANKLGDWVDIVFGSLPDIQTDIETQINAIKALWALGGSGAHAAMSDTAMAVVAVAVGLGVIYRRSRPRGA